MHSGAIWAGAVKAVRRGVLYALWVWRLRGTVCVLLVCVRSEREARSGRPWCVNNRDIFVSDNLPELLFHEVKCVRLYSLSLTLIHTPRGAVYALRLFW